MKRATKLTLLFLGLIVFGIVAALIREAGQNPVFRAADHASFEECLHAIPAEWLDGSVERTGAETACAHIHGPAGSAR